MLYWIESDRQGFVSDAKVLFFVQGDRGSPPKIGGGDVLVFQMEILGIMGDSVPALSCTVDSTDSCNDKELKYIDKVKAWEPTKIKTETERLTNMSATVKMSAENSQWLDARLHILKSVPVPETEL